MTQQQLGELAESYVEGLFEQYDVTALKFHNVEHTKNVKRNALEIATHEQASEQDKVILWIAALFHDTGHLNGGIEGHELRSITMMQAFMELNEVADQTFIEQVAGCILATRIPHSPGTKLEEIMCDADLYHIGTDEFKETNKNVKKEFQKRGYDQLVEDWWKKTYQLLESQRFYTHYCKQLLSEGKERNLEYLRSKMLKKGIMIPVAPVVPADAAQLLEQEPILTKEESKMNQRLVARGIQTVLRLASQNHLELSQMADGKANILISVNAIIISVILSVLINRLDVDTYLTIPTILFLTSSVVTIVIAILATRPKLTEGTFKREDIINKTTNLLFFGNFYKSSLQDYTWAMNKLLIDKDYLHGTQIMDVYYLGQVLGRKYKLIRLAYTIFMVGIVVAVVAFTIAVLANIPKNNLTIIDGSGKPFK